MAQFQLQIRNHAGEVCVAAALAVPVKASLHVRSALFDGCQCVRNTDIGIVMRMDADYSLEFRSHIGDDARKELSESATVCIAKAKHVGPRVSRRLEGLER